MADEPVGGEPVSTPEIPATMDLTNNAPEPSDSLASVAKAEAGAPARIELGSEEIEAMEIAFREWYGNYNHALELGGTGDVFQLLAALMEASPKACIALCSTHAAS